MEKSFLLIMGKKIIDFHAEWCGPCKKQDEILKELEEDIDVEIEKVNVDEETEKVQQHNISSVPTLVIKQDDEVVEDFVGLTQKDTLTDALK